MAQADRMLAQPEQPLVCLAPFPPLLSLLIFTLKAPALPALQQSNLFSSLSSCLLMCFRHRNFIKAALMSTGFSHGVYHCVGFIPASEQITLCSWVGVEGLGIQEAQRRKRSKVLSTHPGLMWNSYPCPQENRGTEEKMKH